MVITEKPEWTIWQRTPRKWWPLLWDLGFLKFLLMEGDVPLFYLLPPLAVMILLQEALASQGVAMLERYGIAGVVAGIFWLMLRDQLKQNRADRDNRDKQNKADRDDYRRELAAIRADDQNRWKLMHDEWRDTVKQNTETILRYDKERAEAIAFMKSTYDRMRGGDV